MSDLGANPQDIIAQIELDDDVYFDAVFDVGTLRNYSTREQIVVPNIIRPAFFLSLLKFRQVWTLTQIGKELEFRRLSLDETGFNDVDQSEINLSEGIKSNQKELDTDIFHIKVGMNIAQHVLFRKLVELGYSRRSMVEQPGEFSVIGGTVDIFLADDSDPIRLEFFGDEIDEIRRFEILTMKPFQILADVEVNPFYITGSLKIDPENLEFGSFEPQENSNFFPNQNSLCVVLDSQQFSEENLDQFVEILGQLHKNDIPTVSISAFGEVKHQVSIKNSEQVQALQDALQGSQLGKQLEELLGRNEKKNKIKKRSKLDPSELEIGDFIVHDLHGIGKFIGKEMIESHYYQNIDGTAVLEEYMVFQYAPSSTPRMRSKEVKAKVEPDYLYVQTDNLLGIEKYIGVSNPKLSKFGGAQFAKVKQQAKKQSRDIARELVKIYSGRVNTKGFAFLTDDQAMKEFEEGFPYELTPDQAKAIDEVKGDMQAPHPMDRLVCGDVGFGKTEVALRAAFKAVISGKQVALLAPTTILTSQHYETFMDRFDKFGVRVELVNRFTNEKKKKKIIEDLKDGFVDIVVGTHSILSERLKFKNLGLLVIDEEQRFGAMHKEQIKSRNLNVDILSMSATPIPRTMEMALTGVRDISVINTPPPDRKPIVTNVMEFSNTIIVDAIRRELMRSGQVFLVHNNTKTIQARASKLGELLPGARIAIAHGSMSETHIDKVINDFWTKKIDVLVCTTIIETGLDIPNANTLIVEAAHKFGLTQLHQLRGRVGRSSLQGYAYFFYQKRSSMTELAAKRLETVQQFNELGQGAQIAVRDLEMRGAGNFLGAEQSGHIQGVGYSMYVRMIEEAVEKMRNYN